MYIFLLVILVTKDADFVAQYLKVHYANAEIQINGQVMLCKFTWMGWRQSDEENVSALVRAGYVSECTRHVVRQVA